MKRTNLKDRVLPNYSRGEEWFNAISHMVGAVLGIVATVLCIIAACKNRDSYAIVGGAVFGATMTALYSVSSIYHALSEKLLAKKVMQVLDHCTIFMLIAGTYTPITLCSVREYDEILGWLLFAVVWTSAIVGIVFNAIDLKKYSIFSVVCYLAMGWCIMVVADKMKEIFSNEAFMLILSGGIAYTIGAVLYGIGSKKPVFHSVFHVFTVIGSLLHFLAVYLYVV